MSDPDPTEAQISRAAVTPAECAAMKMLAADGYTQKELSIFLGIGESAVSKHVNGHCKVHKPPQ